MKKPAKRKNRKGPPPGVSKKVMWNRMVSMKKRRNSESERVAKAKWKGKAWTIGGAVGGGMLMSRFPQLSRIGGRVDTQMLVGGLLTAWGIWGKSGWAEKAGDVGAGWLSAWGWNVGASLTTQGLQPTVAQLVVAA